jgi:tetratricopeptide (TPR) repeat protein
MREKSRNSRVFILSQLILLLLLVQPANAEPPSNSTVPEQNVNDIFDIANEEYKIGNYENAVRLYEGLLSGPTLRDSDIEYNLGNAYVNLGQYGKAIVSYRRALLLSPREQDIWANLRLVRNLVRDKLDSPKSTDMLHEVFFFHYGLNKAEAEIIFLSAYCAAALFGAISLFWKAKSIRWASITALAAALVFGMSLLAYAYRQAYLTTGVITAAEATIHTGPDESYLAAFSLHDGAELEIHKKTDQWYQIELTDGRRGWIEASLIEII